VLPYDCRIPPLWVESPATAPCGFPLCDPDSVESYMIIYSHDHFSFPQLCLLESSIKLKAYSSENQCKEKSKYSQGALLIKFNSSELG
jgi:hypothetical protein